jgi:aminoglycoside 6'-N-acetyltransferase
MELSFRPLCHDDLPMLATWLAAPHVRAWWPDADDLESVRNKYSPLVDGTDPTEAFVICADLEPIGFIQRYRVADSPEWRATIAAAIGDVDGVGIDYLIGIERLTGRGIGSLAIAMFSDDTLDTIGASTSIVVAVQQENRASWRALERSGFRRVWSGQLESTDPSDQGAAHLYVRTHDDVPLGRER